MDILGKQKRKNALTSLFHEYLEYLFRNILQDRKDKYWVREGELDKNLDVDGLHNKTLRDILTTPSKSISHEPNIFVFCGDKGYGKKFYLREMIWACYDKISHPIWDNINNIEFRFPIFVDNQVISQWYYSKESSNSIVELAAHCIKTQLKITDNREKDLVDILALELYEKGRISIFFEENISINSLKIIENIASCDDLYKSIIIFIENGDFFADEKAQQTYNFRKINIEPLNKEQITKYLVQIFPERYTSPQKEAEEAFNKSEELTMMLSKPERLFLFEFCLKDNPKKFDRLNIWQIYDTFISIAVKKAAKASEVDETVLYDWLIEVAKELESGDKKCSKDYYEYFKDTDIFDKNDNFKFDGCKDFLIAKSYNINNINKIDKRIKNIIENYSTKVMCFFAGMIINTGGASKFNAFFNNLLRVVDNANIKNPVEMITEVLVFNDKVQDKLNSFLEWAIQKLKTDVYDSSVFDSLYNLNCKYANGFIDEIIVEQYAKQTDPNIKRRIVYYFGYTKSGMPGEILKELWDAPNENEYDRHLKYHIISAVIDNYDNISKKMKEEYIIKLQKNFSEHKDPILRSNFEVLYYKTYNGKMWDSDGRNQQDCIQQLITLLTKGKYWEKAHAADALGRRPYMGDAYITSITSQLFDVLKTEIDNILRDDDSNNYMRTLVCTIEACYRLALGKESREQEVADKFIRLINNYINNLLEPAMTIEKYSAIHTALSLLIGGIVCLKDKERSLRAVLGESFSRNDTILDVLARYNCLDWLNTDEWSDINEAIQSMDTRVGNETIFKNSIVQIWKGDENIGSGFLYASNQKLYLITCDHIFDKNTYSYEWTMPCFSDINVKDRYMVNTNKNIQVKNVKNVNAVKDISILTLKKVPMSIYKNVFSRKDVSSDIRKKDSLCCLATTPTYPETGKMLSGYYDGSMNPGYFNMIVDKESHINCNGFSGAPIVDSKYKIYGMFKGSEKASEVAGIELRTILEQL